VHIQCIAVAKVGRPFHLYPNSEGQRLTSGRGKTVSYTRYTDATI